MARPCASPATARRMPKRHRKVSLAIALMVKKPSGANNRIDTALPCIRQTATVARPLAHRVAAESKQRPRKRAIAKSARGPLLAVQNFRRRPTWQPEAHFGVYFRSNIWDKLRRIAEQVRPAPRPASASRQVHRRRRDLGAHRQPQGQHGHAYYEKSAIKGDPKTFGTVYGGKRGTLVGTLSS